MITSGSTKKIIPGACVRACVRALVSCDGLLWSRRRGLGRGGGQEGGGRPCRS
jgi:hypothetical protein